MLSPSLRGSGLKFFLWHIIPMYLPSPSLRGSGLKSVSQGRIRNPCVSLFTREWIEIAPKKQTSAPHTVSLFTREWIEIKIRHIIRTEHIVSLFTREWIEIKFASTLGHGVACLPLYEGVDWNFGAIRHDGSPKSLPLYEGVDWNVCLFVVWFARRVSLFTREWIEILWHL